MTEPRRATADDVGALARSLAAAFDDDPVMAWLWPDEATRRRNLPRFFATELRKVHLRHDEVWTEPQVRGGALWAPPGRWRLDARTQLRMAPTMVRLLHVRLPVIARGFATIEAVHPAEPHWYLAMLGTAPEAQGTGVGSS